MVDQPANRNSNADGDSPSSQDQHHENNTTAAPSSSPSETRDLTKTRAYVTIDLVLRTLTALGVVVLGAAGFLFQRSTASSRAAEERADRAAQANLAQIRSLVDFELQLRAISEHSSDVAVTKLHEDARNLLYAARSLFFPNREVELDLTVPQGVRPPGKAVVRSTLRAAGLMIAEVMEAEATAVDLGYQDVEITFGKGDGRDFLAVMNESGFQNVYISELTSESWRTWLTTNARPDDLRIYNYRDAAFRLAVFTAGIEQEVLKANPQLADRYVQIRDEVIRLRSARHESP